MSDNRKTCPVGTQFRVVVPLRAGRLVRAGVLDLASPEIEAAKRLLIGAGFTVARAAA